MPKGKDYVAFEPMSAPTNALISGEGLRLVEPNDEFRAVFRIRVESED
jgi:aldose 1-epimerase